MANNDKNNIDEIHISVEPGTRTADLVERLEKESFSKVTTPGDIKKLVKFYVGQTIQSVKEDDKKYILRPEKVNVEDHSMDSAVHSYQKGECNAEEFVELLVANMKLELLKHRTDQNKGGACGHGFGPNPMMGGMNPMMGGTPNSSFGASITASLMSGGSIDTLDKLMIIKTMSERLESETAGIELECAHKITNCVLDSISEIALSKKTEPSKEEK